MPKYYPRIADEVLKFKLETCGAVLIKGTKWCGKSTTAEQAASSAVYLQDRLTSNQSIELAKNAPDLFLAGQTPRLIDEWQTVPFIWDAVRFEVDHRNANGQFILTGSATPLEDPENAYMHSGIGRIAPMIMRPMTLMESADGTGGISLTNLFNQTPQNATHSPLALEDYAYLTCRGGWPKALELSREAALEQAIIFYEGLVEDDLNRVYKNTKNPERIRRLMRSYSRAISTETSNSAIRKDLLAHEGESFGIDTVTSYINALQKLYVVENLPAWNPNLRSKTALRSSETRHFVDPSIACASLGLGPGDLIGDLKTFGLLFESLCVRDIRVYAEALKGRVFHYRDANGLEADAVVHLRDGRWAAIEVKLASEESINEGASHLLALADKIDVSKMKRPSFLMVLTASEYAYQRKDGVWVVPLGCLEL